MSHRNIVAAIGGIARLPADPLNEKHVYLAYLPLAILLLRTEF
jgi:long-subunit acyl-CoA synthetase (AMP-forming)